MLGGAVAAFGFFFLPLLSLKPNRLAAGIPFNLLQLPGDARYMMLFALTVLGFLVAFRQDRSSRGWLLVMVGNLVLILTLLLPAIAASNLLANATEFLGESAFVRNPRVLPSGGLALGLVGGYIMLSAGGRDLAASGVGRWLRGVVSWIGVATLVLLLASGAFDVYSVMVEFNTNGAALQQKFFEHLMFVAISLLVGFVIGVGLGLWASRDHGVAPVILYAVGIIQTIPSLALFGILLLPLSHLGHQRFLPVLWFFLVALAVAFALGAAFRGVAGRLPPRARAFALVLVAVVAAVPLALFTGVFVSFLFRATQVGFVSGSFGATTSAIGVLAIVTVVLWAARRWLFARRPVWRRLLAWLVPAAAAATGVMAIVLIVQAAGARRFLGSVASIDVLTIRDLGVSGIGVAPALVALTLYSLLPLVRNTFAGLENVDPAVIDSGRGMGMTAWQVFRQIELPLAMPVIMAGVRNAAVALVGIGTVATVIGAGGLGDFVIQGIVNTSIDLILLGALPAIGMALVLDAVLRAVEGLLTSPGVRHA